MLKCLSIEEKLDRAHNAYRVIEFIDETTLKVAKRVFYEDSSKAAFTLTVGDKIPGQVVTQKVRPYNIGLAVRDTCTTVILGEHSEENLPKEIVKVFRKLGLSTPIIDMPTGKPDRPVFAI